VKLQPHPPFETKPSFAEIGWADNIGNEVTVVGAAVRRLYRWRQWTAVDRGGEASSVANISSGRDGGRGQWLL